MGSEIVEVTQGSVAARAGLQVGDVITEIDGTKARTLTELATLLSSRTT
jgi:S1-C subfamily serine protease